MGTIIKTILENIGWMLSWLIPAKAPKLWRAIMAHIYTGTLKHKFAHWGHNSVMAYRANNLFGLCYIKVGDDTQIAKGVQLTAWNQYKGISYNPEIIIGSHCNIRDNVHISAIGQIEIGNNLLTGTGVLITDNSHGTLDFDMLQLPPENRPLFCKGKISIGNNVWLGNSVCILSGVTIGDGAIIGANAVVTHDIPAYSIAVGIPAHVIKQTKI